MIRDNFHACTLIFCLFHSAHSCCFLVRFISLCTLFFFRCLRCCSNLFWLRVPAMLRCPLGTRTSQYRLHFLFSFPPPPPVPPFPEIPREPLAIPSGRYWLCSPTPRSWSSIPQGATVCGVPTASRAVTNTARTSSLAGSPWGASLPRNTRLALLWAMLPDVSSFARALFLKVL